MLKDTDRVGGAQHRDGARQANATGACSRGAQNDRRRRIQVLLTVVLADPKDIETDLVSVRNLFDQVAQPLCRGYSTAALVVRRRETVDADLHGDRLLWPLRPLSNIS